MQVKDIIFFIALLASIPFGCVVKQITSPFLKRFLCTVAGVFVVLLLNGTNDFWHSFVTILATYCICKSVRRCNWVTFICVFGYLFYFRTCTYLGLPNPSPYSDNVQLFITLRMIGLAFEIHEATNSEQKKERHIGDDYKVSKTIEDEELRNMSFYNFLSYGYCYCGIFTGPYYKYKTYTDMLYKPDTKEIPTVDLALKWLTYMPLFMAGYAFFSQWFPAYLGKDQFHNQSIAVQIIYLALADIRFRCRIYIGMHMAESSCMTLCLGAYPVESCPKPGQGPSLKDSTTSRPVDDTDQQDKQLVTSDNKYSFETIRSMYLRHTELSSLKIMVRSWNMTVQWWMAAYVYQKFPYRHKLVRYVAVAVVSAFWHGLAPGYYLSFLFIPFLQHVQDACAAKFLPHLSEKHKVWYHWISWFVGYRLLEYIGVGVWVHTMSLTWRCWRSMYFYGHILLLVFFGLSVVVPEAHSVKEQKKTL